MKDELYTLEQAKKYLRGQWEDGVDCPCCTQFVKLYHRPFHSSMARALILIYKAPTEDGWVHVENYFVDIGVKIKGVHGKLKYWRMLEPQQNTDKAKAKSGYWRLTDLGRLFVENKCTTHKTIDTFKDTVYKRSTEQVNIFHALGKKFDYSELMAGV